MLIPNHKVELKRRGISYEMKTSKASQLKSWGYAAPATATVYSTAAQATYRIHSTVSSVNTTNTCSPSRIKSLKISLQQKMWYRNPGQKPSHSSNNAVNTASR